MPAQNGAYKVPLVAAAGNAGMANIANPEGVDLIVTRVVIDTTTAAAAATNVDVGIGASGASSDTLLDGPAINAVGVVDNMLAASQGNNGAPSRSWPAASFLTVTKSGGNAGSEVGLVANIYIEYIRK